MLYENVSEINSYLHGCRPVGSYFIRENRHSESFWSLDDSLNSIYVDRGFHQPRNSCCGIAVYKCVIQAWDVRTWTHSGVAKHHARVWAKIFHLSQVRVTVSASDHQCFPLKWNITSCVGIQLIVWAFRRYLQFWCQWYSSTDQQSRFGDFLWKKKG